jgi:hypothetical protein
LNSELRTLNFERRALTRVMRGENNDAREDKGGHDYGHDRKESYHHGSSGGGVHGIGS